MGSYGRLFVFLLGVAFIISVQVGSVDIIHENPDPSKVVNTLSLKASPWRSATMVHPKKFVVKKDREWSGRDFFLGEFGIPCDFSKPKTAKIKEVMRFDSKGTHSFRNGALEFTSGKKGFWFAFGPEPNTYGKPSLRFGCKWGKNCKDTYRVRMIVSQNVPETKWEVSTFGFHKRYKGGRKFIIKGKKEQVIEADAGFVRNLLGAAAGAGMCGVRFDCMTPNATVKIKSIKIAPYSGTVYFRKRFNLGELPVIAHATYDAPETYKFYLNGKLVDKGTDVYPGGTVKTLDLKPYLKKGANTICFKKQFFSWSKGNPELIFEGVAIGKSGKITRIICPKGWKSSLKFQKGWENPAFDDSHWLSPKKFPRGLNHVMTSTGSNNKCFWTGVEPHHMGMLQAKPFGRKYPVWDLGKDAKFIVSLPVGVKGKLAPVLKIYKAQTKDLVKKVTAPCTAGKNGLSEYVFTVRKLESGPYRLEWELVNNSGKVRETNRQELIIAGPIEQDKIGFADFEKEFEKRLELLRKIDCATPIKTGEEFCDHSGMYSSAKLNKGKVISADGMNYRETGNGTYDWFAYRLHDMEIGVPHLAEIIIPDNRDRYIYSGIIEQIPCNFECNFRNGDWPDHTATGACITGVDQPLSMGKKKIRFVFWPASKCSAIFVMSGFRGFPAAACEINIYKIKGDLPALKIPESTRMFGSHNERISVMTMTTGISENPLMGARKRRRNGLRDGWLNWYRAIERKIKWLRFQGRNMTVEGVFMYTNGDYPSIRNNSNISNQELDPPMLALKMYNQNGINCMFSVEYQSSPLIWVSKANHTSGRKMWFTGEGLHLVDKYGRQVVGREGAGINFIDPKGAAFIYDCIGEIYDFYKNTGKVAGLFMVVGSWWQPSFTIASLKDISSTDVGYGDYTVSLFEKETGIKLGVNPKSPDRFMKRFEKLMGEHKARWLQWRAQKIKDFFDKLEKLVSAGKYKWPLYIKPAIRIKDNPFLENSSTRQERDRYYNRCYTESGLPLKMYRNSPNINIIAELKAWAKFRSPYDNWMYCKGMSNNRGTREIVRKLNAIFFHFGLDEVDQPAKAAEKWLWSKTGRGVFLPRWAGENAMAEYVNVLSWTIPKVLFYGWLDCNMVTGTGREIRRFAKSFLSTPDLEFKTLPGKNVKGIIAESAVKARKTYLRLVNNCPWNSTGKVNVKAAKIRDLLYDRDIFNGNFTLKIKPYGIRIFELSNAQGEINCSFKLPDKVEKEIFAKTEYVLDDTACVDKIPKDMTESMAEALKQQDAFALRCLMDDFEVKTAITGSEKSREAIKNQQDLLADLRQGRARIICGTETGYRAPDGSRWLPDQKFVTRGAYGNSGANFADRGSIDIQGTNLDRVYQTEAYGAMLDYKIPVPKGKYNLYIHFAETYVGVKTPNMRKIGVKVNNIVHPEKIDPVSHARGWCKPYILKLKNVPAYNGWINIELTGGVVINGIEIERLK